MAEALLPHLSSMEPAELTSKAKGLMELPGGGGHPKSCVSVVLSSLSQKPGFVSNLWKMMINYGMLVLQMLRDVFGNSRVQLQVA